MEQLLVIAFSEIVRKQARELPKPGWVLDRERAAAASEDTAAA